MLDVFKNWMVNVKEWSGRPMRDLLSNPSSPSPRPGTGCSAPGGRPAGYVSGRMMMMMVVVGMMMTTTTMMMSLSFFLAETSG